MMNRWQMPLDVLRSLDYRVVILGIIGIAILTLVACGRGSQTTPTPTPTATSMATPTPTATDISRTTPTPTPTGTSTAPPTPTASDSPIEFVMEDNYTLGQDIEIKIRNNGTGSYVYSEYYPACSNLKFYDESEEARQLKSFGRIVELPPGLFIIPEGTHCDLVGYGEINPGEKVVLLTWSQRECVRDDWGCGESVPVKPGKYTIVGRFGGSMGSSVTVAAEWSFAIIP